MELETYQKALLFAIGLLIGSLVILVLVSDWFYQAPYFIKFKAQGYTEENAIAICSSNNLKGTAICLNSFVRGIYKFKSRKDSETPSFDELVEEGGDCRNWQMLYCKLGTQMGYDCTKVSIPVEKRDGIQYKHTWAVLTSSTGYCNLDGRDINCFKYAK